MSTTETDQPIGGTPEEVPGFYLFTLSERAVYLEWVAASKDISLPAKKRANYRSHAARKLKKVIEQRMPIAEKLVLEANTQAAANLKHEENRQMDEYALSLCTPKQREVYVPLSRARRIP
jgi:hypothetical protein